MKKFACKDIGLDCAWTHAARTEELLLDSVALHLRDVHHIVSLTQERAGKIKNTFTNPSPVDGEVDNELVLKEFACDFGPKCAWHYIAQTEDLIADGVALHAREMHDIKEFTPEMKAHVENSLRVWRG